MEGSRRSQLHSCDPCRKGKRGCDAPKDRQQGKFNACSNCKRWKKQCTFNWIVKRGESKGNRRKARPSNTNSNAVGSHPEQPDEVFRSAQEQALKFAGFFASPESLDYASSSPSQLEAPLSDTSQFILPSQSDSQPFKWEMGLPYDLPISPKPVHPLNTYQPLMQGGVMDSPSSSVESTQTWFPQQDRVSDTLLVPRGPEWGKSRRKHHPEREYDQSSSSESQWSFCIASENTAKTSARAAMSRNLIRIYHDSMENALSCWLTEHNCPYIETITKVLPGEEWGPSWSNRMCIRVCKLDRISSSIRGRDLSAEENKTAARALHLAIMSFASQWTQHAEKGIGASVPAAIDEDERLIRENVWNEARQALQQSSGIPSFRIAFANIIFSLTQSPLDKSREATLDQLLQNDPAPTSLEAANRQLFIFRHKFTRLQREAAASKSDARGGSILANTHNDHLSQPSNSQLDPILTSYEHRTTLGLMFWLGVMFDTLSAAMYQRPLVVSDEDSQIASIPSIPTPETNTYPNQWDQSLTPTKQDVWGDYFLQSSIKRQETQYHPRWPCSYQEAASILSEATPVKVLLYRRVTQLQTLIYRGANPSHIESLIQKTLSVYEHWDSTYRPFMVDCVTNHDLLPSRIQSWYVILDGHWHLSAMLLADVLESIDKCRLGCDSAREARQFTNIVATLRTNNALAVAALARASIQGQDSFMGRDFHDSLNEVAFLVEPWTAVLVHCFAKAGYILLDNLDMSVELNIWSDRVRQNCEFAIRALQYLGRKSDMAFVVARNLSRSLNSKLYGASWNIE
ncbi:unnamed protein product [Penicillium olsonii]|uniref:Zn(2)-C6 fungal-type domain-containing protein n=1 Tax=Penicillium olsonii TaxID=99116 RepID=A0A9W4HI77_PENOL|nr:unnamed protein product [Penicillium olsonii]CAG8070731.1 unnamed protein product [Penicillium olsonii]